MSALITGGAGFVGCNLADRLAAAGEQVVVFDSLARAGVEENLDWLRDRHGPRIRFIGADVRDAGALREAVEAADSAFHFAAQVAVTTSVVAPVEDFEVNARGTLNLLEALRARPEPIPLVFASTNKVYGALPELHMQEHADRHLPADQTVRMHGVSERQPLDFHSPYGCSKGAADQYVIDYARIYGLPQVVLRMSCIYGPRQFGTEDQGWVAHFLIAALRREPITIYGDGKQVRDLLFIDDAVDAFLLARQQAARLAGQAFNLGGGAGNTVSLRELLQRIADLDGAKPRLRFDGWRPGDQPWYVADTRAFTAATGWRAAVDVDTGVRRLHGWLAARVAAPEPVAERVPA